MIWQRSIRICLEPSQVPYITCTAKYTPRFPDVYLLKYAPGLTCVDLGLLDSYFSVQTKVHKCYLVVRNSYLPVLLAFSVKTDVIKPNNL